MGNKIYRNLSLTFVVLSAMGFVASIIFYLKGKDFVNKESASIMSVTYASSGVMFFIEAIIFIVLAVLFIVIYQKNKKDKKK